MLLAGQADAAVRVGALLLAPLFAAPAAQASFRPRARSWPPVSGPRSSASPSTGSLLTSRASPASGRASLSLAIAGDGVVTETLNNDAGELVVQLTYQLGYPEIKAGTSSADTKITKVTVGHRKLIKGRVPRVGATGTLRVTRASSGRRTSRRATATPRSPRRGLRGVAARRLICWCRDLRPRRAQRRRAGFFLNGLLFASWISRIPVVRDSLGLDNGQLGLRCWRSRPGRCSRCRRPGAARATRHGRG